VFALPVSALTIVLWLFIPVLCVDRIPCHQKFLAHFENFRTNPRSFIAPLKSFLNLNQASMKEAGETLEASIDSFAKQKKPLSTPKFARDLVPKLCSRKDSDKKCHKEVSAEGLHLK
jgi:hypothetical protein